MRFAIFTRSKEGFAWFDRYKDFGRCTSNAGMCFKHIKTVNYLERRG